jgi:hypothetical protein
LTFTSELSFRFFFPFSVLIEKTVNILLKDFHVRWKVENNLLEVKKLFFLYLKNYFLFSCLLMTNFSQRKRNRKQEKTLDSLSLAACFFFAFVVSTTVEGKERKTRSEVKREKVP